MASAFLDFISIMRETRPHVQGLFSLSGSIFMVLVVSGSARLNERCECPGATITSHLPPQFPNHTCCVNSSGSLFPQLPWDAFRSSANLQILDLSMCNITDIVYIRGSTPGPLQELYLSQNRLRVLPDDFLADATALEVVDLGQNLLEMLPVDFLKNADSLRVLILSGNRLDTFSMSVLKLSLQQLDLADNPWACSCPLVEVFHSTDGNSSSLRGIGGNLTCATPHSLSGRSIRSVQVDDVCRLSGLKALFIILPVLLLTFLTLCWCCGRKENKPGVQNFNNTNNKNLKSFPPLSHESAKEDAMLKNQLMLRPSSELLGSTRDIYEEVELKLGSVESLERPPSASSGKVDTQEVDGKQDLETVSVTEVMRDSSDREKAYMTQTTKYYSLVPGLDMDDSDHADYESVDLS